MSVVQTCGTSHASKFTLLVLWSCPLRGHNNVIIKCHQFIFICNFYCSMSYLAVKLGVYVQVTCIP